MLTREQEHTIERLSHQHDGRSLAIREGFEEGVVHVFLPGLTISVDRLGDDHIITRGTSVVFD